ncbi:hypothetical protein Sa4125_16210 [Aureimonas sp. SA4125]|uniref:DUF3563 family protein n=1 Tax=Aureimonas sp. SA4125 TaxID=2826993 RepID=UPI001CC7566F|nr:DUF3563 family protein [Aureimonas sp. SA4125]BDA84079.1 hypothetical protein Sa4125_16210 [Aureimonas sp. SA4125]
MNILSRSLRAAFGQRNKRDRAMDYLNESVSIDDLERRQREIDQGMFARRPNSY